MREFRNLLANSREDAEYLRWMRENPKGVVVNLLVGKKGKFTKHRTGCQTISYDIAAKGQRERPDKLAFESTDEFWRWHSGIRDPKFVELNPCGRCKPSV